MLEAFFNSAGGAGWQYSINWLTDAPLGQWYGVVTDSDGQVIGLNLSHNGLRGEIPAELGKLTTLEWLWLRGNKLIGEIPSELKSLVNLKQLNLAGNQLSGGSLRSLAA